LQAAILPNLAPAHPSPLPTISTQIALRDPGQNRGPSVASPSTHFSLQGRVRIFPSRRRHTVARPPGN